VKGVPSTTPISRRPCASLDGTDIVTRGHGRLQRFAAVIGGNCYPAPWRRRSGNCFSGSVACATTGLVDVRALPSDMIDDIRASHPGRWTVRVPETAIARKPSTSTQGFAGVVIEAEAAFHEIVAVIDDARPDAYGGPRRTENTMREETHGSFIPRTTIFDRGGAGGEGLQRAIEQHRVQRKLVGAEGGRFGTTHVALGFASAAASFAGWDETPRRSAGRDRSCSRRSR